MSLFCFYKLDTQQHFKHMRLWKQKRKLMEIISDIYFIELTLNLF